MEQGTIRLKTGLAEMLKGGVIMARQLSGFARLEKMADALPHCGDPQTFAAACLTALGVRLDCPRDTLARIPLEGPVVLYANHPSGALEGLMLAALCGKVRPDLKIIASDVLLRIPQLAQLAPMTMSSDTPLPT